MQTWTFIILLLAVALMAAAVTAVLVHRRLHRKVTFMLDALEDGETAFRYREENGPGRKFNRSMNRLRGIFEAEREAIREQDRYYGKMLDSIRTGILVTDEREAGAGRVIYSNAAARAMLGTPVLSHVRQLSAVSGELMEAFGKVASNREARVSFNNERSRVTLSLTASEARLDGHAVKIVAFNDISGEISHNEEVSWNRLIRVLTHEIMNTVTPIASLSDTLCKDLSEACAHTSASDAHAAADACRPLSVEELKRGLETISSSSKGLIRFVDTYRSLTRVSAPVKKAFYVRELLERVAVLTAEKVKEAGAEFIYVEQSDDILLYADAGQISQLLVNLVKNALQAGAKRVRMEASINFAERVLIRVSNNGRPIPPEAADEIFVPFYTTKSDGSGIGLSLSRQIMRLHNGSISLERSDGHMTVFVLEFR